MVKGKGRAKIMLVAGGKGRSDCGRYSTVPFNSPFHKKWASLQTTAMNPFKILSKKQCSSWIHSNYRPDWGNFSLFSEVSFVFTP